MMVIVLFPRTSWFRIASYFFFAGAFCSYHLERNIPSLWSVGRRAGSLRVGPRGRNPCHRYSQHAQKLMQDWFPAGLLCVKFKPNLFIFRRGNSSPSAVGSSSPYALSSSGRACCPSSVSDWCPLRRSSFISTDFGFCSIKRVEALMIQSIEVLIYTLAPLVELFQSQILFFEALILAIY